MKRVIRSSSRFDVYDCTRKLLEQSNTKPSLRPHLGQTFAFFKMGFPYLHVHSRRLHAPVRHDHRDGFRGYGDDQLRRATDHEEYIE